MIKIRKNVFETNSSSMHSLAIDIFAKENRYTPDEILDDLRSHNSTTIFVDDENKQITITADKSDEFSYDWGFDVYSDFTNKFIYAIANLAKHPLDLSLFTAEISKLIGYTINIIDSRNGRGSVAYIDHQSFGSLPSYIECAGTNFIDFVLDKNIYLVIDTDNK